RHELAGRISGRGRRDQNTLRTSHSPAVPIADIINAPPSAHPKLSTLRRSVSRSVSISRIASMIHRVMNARRYAMPSVTIVNTPNRSQPSRKFRMPKIAATSMALTKSLTWKPGKTADVIHTAIDSISQETSRLIARSSEVKVNLLGSYNARERREPAKSCRTPSLRKLVSDTNFWKGCPTGTSFGRGMERAEVGCLTALFEGSACPSLRPAKLLAHSTSRRGSSACPSSFAGVGWLVVGQLSQLAEELPEYRDNIREKLADLRELTRG